MFRLSAAVALLALAASSAAYSISRPEDGAIWDPSQPQIIAWSKVNTDPQTFAITLVHQASQPNTRQLLEDSVDGGQGSITVNPPSGGWPSGTAYQINFVQDSNHLDSILAQSQQFDIKASTGSSGSSSSSSSSSSSVSVSSSSSSRTVSSSGTTPTSLTNSQTTGSGTGSGSAADLNPSTTDTTDAPSNTNAASTLGVQAGVFGFVAMGACALG
ncbi:unnamed protein product [Somion occarium]|uniref:Yeast cell wall synthesis Kre9/Knh1-like N-terminal domain-containing protein n=1 Tax=Somion occarium TaxID=3059160 RepID=A0ABP1CZT1_9APHY